MTAAANVYKPRNPQDSDYYQCVEDNFEEFVQVYDEQFEQRFGYWRPYVEQVITRYLECGDLHNGFARVKCPDCQHEYLLAFSCKRRHFCPSCHQKRVAEFGEWLCSDVLRKVPHRHVVFSIPKLLRRYFLYDRALLSGLSRAAWDSLKVFLNYSVPEDNTVPGAVVAIQTFGDFLQFNPHDHILVTDGCFYGDKGMFRVAPPLELKKLEAIFKYKVFKMLKDKGKINDEMISMLNKWRHSGFNVYCGKRISPDDEQATENIARYIIRASFSQERMTYLPEEGQVVYRAKDGRESKTFDSLEWLAAMCSHIPNKGEQMVRYYGYYSNVSRGMRLKENAEEATPCILDAAGSTREYRKSWARLIQKIYEVDPLTCPKCQGEMRIISFIEDRQVIRDILEHLGLWLVKSRTKTARKAHGPPDEYFEAAVEGDNTFAEQGIADYGDPEYSWDEYVNS